MSCKSANTIAREKAIIGFIAGYGKDTRATDIIERLDDHA